MARKIIVTVDGGGIRGIIPLLLLKEIQDRLPRNFFEFDISWWGTSTGALITGSLVVQKQLGFKVAIRNVLDLYEFRAAAAVNPKGASLPARALNQLINANFGDLHLTDFPELNIVASEEETLEALVFNQHNSCGMANAISASCAFPSVFPAVEIDGAFYVDGFFKAKNPTILALNHLELEALPIVLSLGTGELRAMDDIELSVKKVDEEMAVRATDLGFDYFRFNPVLKHAVDDMQNTSAKNIFNLRKDAMHYILENEALIGKVVDLLMKQ